MLCCTTTVPVLEFSYGGAVLSLAGLPLKFEFQRNLIGCFPPISVRFILNILYWSSTRLNLLSNQKVWVGTLAVRTKALHGSKI